MLYDMLTLQIILPEPPYRDRHHQVCGFADYEHVETILANCHQGYSPEVFKFPKVTSCSCRECDPMREVCM